MNDSMKRSVDSLQKIYAVIIGLALTETLKKVIGLSGDAQISSHGIMSLISLLALVVPFYHGMNRHLDICYLEKPNDNPIVRGALLLDFFVFCIESCLLFVFIKHIDEPIGGFKILGWILIVDIIWGIISNFIHYRTMKGVIKWAIINIITIILGILIIDTDCIKDTTKILTILAVVRTVADYYICWDFYFPEVTKS